MDDLHATVEQRRLDAEAIIARRRAFLQRAQAQMYHSEALLQRVKERLQAQRATKAAKDGLGGALRP